MPTCVIRRCTNRPETRKRDMKKLNVTFHRFPVNKPDLMQEWLESIGTQNMKDHIKTIHETSIICSEHFETSCIKYMGKRNRLLPDAVPTLFNCGTLNVNKTGRWNLIPEADEIEAVVQNVVPFQEPIESTNPDPQVFPITNEPMTDDEIEFAFTTKKDDPLALDPLRMKSEDDDVSLSCLSPSALSQQVVSQPALETVITEPTLQQTTISFPLLRKKQLKIPSTCLESLLHDDDPQPSVVSDSEQQTDSEAAPALEKLVILRAKSKQAYSNSKMKRLKFPRKIPAQIIKEKKNKPAVKKEGKIVKSMEWLCPKEELVCVTDIDMFEEDKSLVSMLGHSSSQSSQLCRVCASASHKMIQIFGAEGKQLSLAEKIHRFLPIQVEDHDRLPLQVCLSCVTRLNACEQLVECSHDADLKLRLLLDAEDLQIEVEELLVPHSSKETIEDHKQEEEPKNVSYFNTKKSYTCLDCNKVFNEFKSYSRHCYGVHKKKKCKNCELFFNTREELIKHKTEEHGIQCDQCGMKFTGIQAQLTHLRREHPEYKACTCELCGKSFNSKYGLAYHYECHQEDKPFLCDACGKSFKSKRKLKIHRCISGTPETTDPKNICAVCGKVYTLKSSLQRHLIRHRGDRRYECEICHKKFFGGVYLKNHMVIHEKATLYECQMCCARYFHKRNMISHIKDKHSTTWNYKCPSCDQIFGTIDDVVMHRKIHDIENIALGIPQESDIPIGSCLDFQCKICGKNFENIYLLTYHFEEHVIRTEEELNIRTVGNEGAFQCAYCGDTSASIWTMKRHVKRLHSGAQLETRFEYECEICSKKFATRAQMKQHIWQHTGERPFKCQHCDAGFRTRMAVNIHARIHTGEMPFQCIKCPKKFRSAATLRVHHLTHDKPFSCSQCGQRFPKRSLFHKHLSSHTNDSGAQQTKRSVLQKCKTCDFACKTKVAMRKHEASHESTPLQSAEPTYFNL